MICAFAPLGMQYNKPSQGLTDFVVDTTHDFSKLRLQLLFDL